MHTHKTRKYRYISRPSRLVVICFLWSRGMREFALLIQRSSPSWRRRRPGSKKKEHQSRPLWWRARNNLHNATCRQPARTHIQTVRRPRRRHLIIQVPIGKRARTQLNLLAIMNYPSAASITRAPAPCSIQLWANLYTHRGCNSILVGAALSAASGLIRGSDRASKLWSNCGPEATRQVEPVVRQHYANSLCATETLLRTTPQHTCVIWILLASIFQSVWQVMRNMNYNFIFASQKLA